jgi:hypothetical protein
MDYGEEKDEKSQRGGDGRSLAFLGTVLPLLQQSQRRAGVAALKSVRKHGEDAADDDSIEEISGSEEDGRQRRRPRRDGGSSSLVAATSPGDLNPGRRGLLDPLDIYAKMLPEEAKQKLAEVVTEEKKHYSLSYEEVFGAPLDEEKRQREEAEAASVNPSSLSLIAPSDHKQPPASDVSAPAVAQSTSTTTTPYLEPLNDLMRAFNKKRLSKQQRNRIYNFMDLITNPQSQETTLGELRFEEVKRMAFEVIPGHLRDQHGEPVSLDPIQMMFINAFISACAPLIFGRDWIRCKTAYLKAHDIQEVIYQALAMSPRRFGKTWSVAIFVVAMLWCIPGIEIAIFSTNLRAAKAMIGWIRKFMMHLPGGADRLANDAQIELHVVPKGAENLPQNKKRSHPGNSKVIAYPGKGEGDVLLLPLLLLLYRRVLSSVAPCSSLP